MKKNRAFTLTELLVVVVVIGVLSTVILPKFYKLFLTRRTTEAEEMMRAIRTEQELRCELGKNYATDFKALADLMPSQNANGSSYQTQSYTYRLREAGIEAVHFDTGSGDVTYRLAMPYYADGRICCDGTQCKTLNKDYIPCNQLPAAPVDPACAGPALPDAPTMQCGWYNAHMENHGEYKPGKCAEVCEGKMNGADCGTCDLSTQGQPCAGEYITGCDQDCHDSNGNSVDFERCENGEAEWVCATTVVYPMNCTCSY